MSNIPPDFVAFKHGWQRAIRFERLSSDCWIERSWHRKWLNLTERSDAWVAEVYKKADLIMVPQEFEKTRRYLCERCGGTGQQEAGCWSGTAYDAPAGTCTTCNGEGYLAEIKPS